MAVLPRVALVLGASVAIAAAPRPARAEVGVVSVAARSAPETGATVEAALGRALEASGTVVQAGALESARRAQRDGAVPADQLTGFTRVRELVDEGWRAYLEVQTEFAVARLGEARRQSEALLVLDGGLVAYAEAALRLGAALDNAGRRGEADDVLRLAGALDPGRAVTVQEFSPDVVAAFARARDATPARRTVTVVVHDDAGAVIDGAQVEVDGGAAGPPGAVELAHGQHVVVARAGGHLARGLTFSVDAGDDPVAIVLERDEAAAALQLGPVAGQSERAAAGWVEAVLTFGDLEGVVLASSIWRSGRPALLVQWCDGAPASCTAVVEVGHEPGQLDAAARAAVEELAAARTGRRYRPTLPGDPRVQRADRPVVPGARCRWCRPALWIGAGAVVIAATTLVLVLASGDDPGTVVGIDPDDFVE